MGDFSSNNWVPLSSTHQFHTKGPLLFIPQNPLVQQKKSFGSTRSSVPHQIPLSSTPKPPQFIWGVRWTEGCVELRSVWNWGLFGVELKDLGDWKGVALLCGTDVLNWGAVELRAILFLLSDNSFNFSPIDPRRHRQTNSFSICCDYFWLV